MVKVRGQKPNRNTVEQTAKKFRRRGRHYVTGARRQEFKAAESGLEFDQA